MAHDVINVLKALQEADPTGDNLHPFFDMLKDRGLLDRMDYIADTVDILGPKHVSSDDMKWLMDQLNDWLAMRSH